MRRRQFLGAAARASLAGAAAMGASAAVAQTTDRQQGATAAPSTLPPDLIGPSATDAYFSEAKLHAALGTEQLRRPASVQVLAFNFPSWHPSPYMEARFGKGWTEFDTLRNARSLFPGHSMPHYPLWGYYNEAAPEWAAKEIDLAANYGVDAWLIDWYWHQGTQFYQEQLEQGFLEAPNRDRLKFAVMWANHDWKNVYPARSPDEAAMLLPQVHTLPDFDRVADYCASRYFKEPNYFRIDGAPLFAIFDAGKIIDQLGEDGLKQALVRMRERARKLGFAEIHLQIVGGYDRYAMRLREFGFDSATQYGTFGWTYGTKPPGSRLPYGLGASEAVASWQKLRETLPLPFHPCAQVGWDDSPRFEEYSAIAINRSPDQFERLVRAARHVAADSPHKLVYVAAWNEWTEDHVLLPDTLWGYSYLEALRRAVRDS